MNEGETGHGHEPVTIGRRMLLTGAIGTVAGALVVPDDDEVAWATGQLAGGESARALVPEVWRPAKGQAAITFDDGPHSTTTDKVLAILKRRGVPATFFMIGISAQRLPKVVQRVAWAGHSVQVHNWGHARLDTKSYGGVQADLSKTKALLRKLSGRSPVAFRPPYGYTNSTVRRAGESIGLRQVMWNACPDLNITSASQGLKQVLSHVAIAKRKGVGATILLHDGTGKRGLMLEMLSPLITELRNRGWKLVKYT